MDEPKEQTVRKWMSAEERAALAKKLDDDLDRFIDDLATRKKKGSDELRKPFNFDEWCKELDQHPAFMKDLKPDENGEFPEAVQALQALKYDSGETEEERIETAKQHKLEGNKHFRYKKYRWARDCYTNGIKVLCTDRQLNSVLLANRAAAQKHLGNLRSAVRDCVFARRFDPFNYKAVIRCAECLIELGFGKQCLEWIQTSKDAIEKAEQESADEKRTEKNCLDELRARAVQCALVEERDARKKKLMLAKEVAAKKRLLDTFAARRLCFEPKIDFSDPSLFEWSQVEVRLPQTQSHQRVYVDGSGTLHWPLLVQYPEVGQTDFLTECCEDSRLGDLFDPLFEKPAPWDYDHRFRRDNVRFFVTLDEENEVNEVFNESILREIFSLDSFVILQGLPVIQVYTRERVEESFSNICDSRYQVL